MKEFTGWEYLLLDVSNYYENWSKKTFEQRLIWAHINLQVFEMLADKNEWKDKPLYIKAVQAVRRAQAGTKIGHLVSMDAVCSGMQIMSVLTGCINGARATGLIDTDLRSDAYAECAKLMSTELGYSYVKERKKVKNAVMTALYGSKAEPKKEFGEDTPELEAFQKALYKMAPGACEMLQDLMDSWQPWTLVHTWTMPDGFNVRIKVKQRVEHKIEVDELDHTHFTYVYYENLGEEAGVKNVANVTHSIDAYILRCVLRRCNYNLELVKNMALMFEEILLQRSMVYPKKSNIPMEEINYEVMRYIDQYNRTKMADIYILPHLTRIMAETMNTDHIRALNIIVQAMLQHEPFPVITIHDDYKCHPNYMNHLRRHYREILAELADSELLSNLLSQIHGITSGKFKKLSPDLSKYIRNSNYSLS